MSPHRAATPPPAPATLSTDLLSAGPVSPGALSIVPVGLRVEGKAVLVVGGGRIAARKAQPYVAQGAVVTVVAPHHSEQMRGLDVAIRHVRAFRPSDAVGKWLVVTATGLPQVDHEVFLAAEAQRIWCNAADDPDNCSIILPAVARRGDVTVAISSGGRSPATASWLRRRIESMIDDDTLAVLEVAARVRHALRSAGKPTEVDGWADVLDADATRLVACGREGDFEERLRVAVGLEAQQ